jgi:hypothetical protein
MAKNTLKAVRMGIFVVKVVAVDESQFPQTFIGGIVDISCNPSQAVRYSVNERMGHERD